MLRRLLPFSRVGLAWWAWRNRDTVADWSQFAARSAGSLLRGGSLDDARAELRLRTSLATDRRTRGAHLTVTVTDGVARIAGRASADARDAAVDQARGTRGISRVHEDVEVPSARRRRVRSA